MKNLAAQFFYHIASYNFTQINTFLEDHCLFIHDEKTILGKDKILAYLENKLDNHPIKHISILNSVQDSKDTLLISYHMIISSKASPVYGSAIIRINERKINYIKNFIVK